VHPSGDEDAGVGEARDTLSRLLRIRTAAAHGAVEASLGLPQAIDSRAGYIACLRRFHGLYRPVEARLHAFAGWSSLGIDLATRSLAARLAADLGRLHADPDACPDAPPEATPDLPTFAHALGALYVLQGSALGGPRIRRHLIETGLEEHAERCAFFGAGGADVGALWRAFRDTLDRYGRTCPDTIPAVIAGAERTFVVVGRWMDASSWRNM